MKNELKICSCGRVHLIPFEKREKAIAAGKELLFICGGCGHIIAMGATEGFDYNEPDRPVYDLYSRDHNCENLSVTADSFNNDKADLNISEIYYSKGIRVPMMTGEYAQQYSCDHFSDMLYIDLYELQGAIHEGKTVEQVYKEYGEKRRKVDMDRLISENSDEVLAELSQWYIRAFDWTGTKYTKQEDAAQETKMFGS